VWWPGSQLSHFRSLIFYFVIFYLFDRRLSSFYHLTPNVQLCTRQHAGGRDGSYATSGTGFHFPYLLVWSDVVPVSCCSTFRYSRKSVTSYCIGLSAATAFKTCAVSHIVRIWSYLLYVYFWLHSVYMYNMRAKLGCELGLVVQRRIDQYCTDYSHFSQTTRISVTNTCLVRQRQMTLNRKWFYSISITRMQWLLIVGGQLKSV